ncbi:MAG: thioredoxin domain-containing protein [Gaiellaceae bacterium]
MASMKSGDQGSGISRRAIMIAFGVAVAAAAVLVGVALVVQGGDDSATAGPATDLDGIAQEGIVLGNPEAEVLLIEYADMQCSFCRDYSVDVFPTLVDEYVRPGDVRMEFRGLAFLGPDSEKALRFVLAAGLQDHGWELQDALFVAQGEVNSGWVTDELVRELAAEIEGLDVDKMFEDADSAEVTSQIEAAAGQGQADQVPGTPTFFIKIGDDDPYLIQVPLEPDAFRPPLDDALQG